MPWNRESVDELLRAASRLDLWSIHYKLLTDGVAFLTIDEFSELSTHYKEVFDNQLPCEMNSLDDMGYSVFCPDFDSILENYVEKMPCNRESANEMLKAISGSNLWPIYYKLLTECSSLLTIEEHSKIETDNKKH